MAGLPNITASSPSEAAASIWLASDKNAFDSYWSGAIKTWYGSNWAHGSIANNTTLSWGMNFNASWVSSIYGSSDTVTPLSLKTKFFIKY